MYSGLSGCVGRPEEQTRVRFEHDKQRDRLLDVAGSTS